MYHPSLMVWNCEAAAEFLGRVFGRSSVRQENFDHKWALPGYPIDYSIWTVISDVWFDGLDLKRYRWRGEQVVPELPVSYKLTGLG